MFAGVLLSAGVSFVVAQNVNVIHGITRLFLPIAFGQLALAIGIQMLMPRLSAMTALALFFVYAATSG